MEKKELYTAKEVLDMGFLPFTSRKTFQRRIREGKIRVVPALTTARPRVFIPASEVERLREAMTLQTANKSMKGSLESN